MTGKAIVVLISAFVAAVGAVANALWGPRAQARKRLDRGRTTTIADGEIVTLTGTVRAIDEPLIAPLSGRSCVLYEAAGKIDPRASAHDPADITGYAAEARMVAFELETKDGTVRVEGDRADLDIPPTSVIPRRIERERAFFTAHNALRGDLRYASCVEVAIEPGMKIRVQGMAVVELDASAPEAGYRDAARRIRLVAHADHPLTIGRAR